jgi:hypothetical protein
VLSVTDAGEGDTLAERLGLKKLPRLNFREGVGVAAGIVAAGVGVASVCTLFRGRFVLGKLGGDSTDAGEAGVSAGEAIASALFCWRCFFGGEGDSAGSSGGAAT